MKKLYLIFFILVIVYAKKDLDLLKTLNEVNEIAFQAKLNIDKTPSNVTVLKRDFIQKTGAKTLFDLLKYIPGIQTSISSSGKKILIIRGNRSLYRDKIKFLVNGVSITNNLYTNQFYYYNFPTSLIKRVEITLTPDSVTYGDNAFLGVINIITLDKLNDNQFSFYKNDKKGTSFSIFQKFNNINLDAYYEYFNPYVDPVDTYLIDVAKRNYILYRRNSPYEYEKNMGFGIKYKKNNSTLMYRINYYKKGNFFGLVNLPPIKDDKYIEFTHQYLNYNYSKFLNDNWTNNLNIGIKNYRWEGEFRLFPYDFNTIIDNNPDNDIISGALINEYELYIKDRLTFINEKHITNYFAKFKYAKPYNYYYLQYIPAFNNKQKLRGENNILKEGIYRKLYEVGMEDLYFFNEKISFTYGGRYSYYNDFGSNFAYKIGGIYNLNEFTTFKLLYNTAFRAPSWAELYAKSASSFNGNPNLKPEKIRMGEFIYTQKFKYNNEFKFVYYVGKESNYIGRKVSLIKGKEVYQNLGSYLIRGLEVSYKHLLQKGFLGVSYSFNDNDALFSNEILGIDRFNYLGIRKNFYKGYFSYKLNNNLNLFMSAFYGSKIKTPPITSYTNNYFSLNSNILYQKNNLKLQVGIDNITNHKNYYFVLPSDIIYNRYAFVQHKARCPEVGRKVYINIIKSWR